MHMFSKVISILWLYNFIYGRYSHIPHQKILRIILQEVYNYIITNAKHA